MNLAPQYTFSTKGYDGTAFYPKRVGDQISWIADWTTDVSKAITWKKPEDFDCLMAEYCDTEVIEIIGTVAKIYKVVQ